MERYIKINIDHHVYQTPCDEPYSHMLKCSKLADELFYALEAAGYAPKVVPRTDGGQSRFVAIRLEHVEFIKERAIEEWKDSQTRKPG